MRRRLRLLLEMPFRLRTSIVVLAVSAVAVVTIILLAAVGARFEQVFLDL